MTGPSAAYMVGMTTKRGKTTPKSTGGSFAAHERAVAEVSIDGAVLTLDGGEVSVVRAGDVPLSLAQAKRHLDIPDTESDELLFATIGLLDAPGDEDAPWPLVVETAQRYGHPGDQSQIDTAAWGQPGSHPFEYVPAAEAWFDAVTGAHVVAASVRAPIDAFGFTEDETIALHTITADHVDEKSLLLGAPVNFDSMDATVREGELRIRLREEFSEQEFTPDIIANRYSETLAAINLNGHLQTVRQHGVVLKDSDLRAAQGIDGPAIAYAAKNGRRVSDIEIVAVLKAFTVISTLRDGYLLPGTGEEFTEDRMGMRFGTTQGPADRALVLVALNSWWAGRTQVAATDPRSTVDGDPY